MEDNRLASDLLLLLSGGEGAGASSPGHPATDFPALLPAETASVPGLGHDLHQDDTGSRFQSDPLGSALATPAGTLYQQQQRGNGGISHYSGGPGELSEMDFLRTPPPEDEDGEADSTGDPVNAPHGAPAAALEAPAAAHGTPEYDAPAAEGTAEHVAQALGADAADAAPRQQAAPHDQQLPPQQQQEQQQKGEKEEAGQFEPHKFPWQQEQRGDDLQSASDQGSDQALSPSLQRSQQGPSTGHPHQQQQGQQEQQEQQDQQQLDEGDQQEMLAHHQQRQDRQATPAELDTGAVTGTGGGGGGSGGGVILSTHDREWLLAITTAMGFFKPCGRQHPGGLRGTDGIATFFDVDDPSSGPMCGLCAGNPARARHRVVQVRRSTYHEVLKLSDVAALMDVTGIQPYVINAAKVLFLRPRPQPRAAKGGAAMPALCTVDGRQLMDNGSRYCSIRCKLETEDAPFAAALAAVKPHEPYVPRPTSRAATHTHHRPAKPPKDGTPKPGGRTPPGERPSSRATSDNDSQLPARRNAASPTASGGAVFDGAGGGDGDGGSRPGSRTASPNTVSSGGATAGTGGTVGRKRGRQARSPALAAAGVFGPMAPVLEEGDEEGVHFNAGGLREVELPHWGTQVRRGRGTQLNMSAGGVVVHRPSDDGGVQALPQLHDAELSDSCSQKRRRGARDTGASGADSATLLARAERRMRARRAAATGHNRNMVSDEADGGAAGDKNPGFTGNGGSVMTTSRTTGGDSAFDSTGSHRRKALTPQRSPLQ